jgi:hypothetical protein
MGLVQGAIRSLRLSPSKALQAVPALHNHHTCEAGTLISRGIFDLCQACLPLKLYRMSLIVQAARQQVLPKAPLWGSCAPLCHLAFI